MGPALVQPPGNNWPGYGKGQPPQQEEELLGKTVGERGNSPQFRVEGKGAVAMIGASLEMAKGLQESSPEEVLY